MIDPLIITKDVDRNGIIFLAIKQVILINAIDQNTYWSTTMRFKKLEYISRENVETIQFELLGYESCGYVIYFIPKQVDYYNQNVNHAPYIIYFKWFVFIILLSVIH